jgi:putative MATE family efflux protein
MDNQREFLLTGDLPKVMWSLALPAIAAMVLYGLNAFMDTVFVGQLMDQTALAGISLAYPLVGLTMGLANLSGTGAANLLSIAIGEEDLDTQRKILPNSNLIVLIMSLSFAIPAYIFAPELIAMMGGAGEVQAYGVVYLRNTLYAAPLWTLGLSLNFIIRGEGKMRVAARMMAYGLGLNLILTPILIKYGGMGLAGAAWASNCGMLVYCIAEYRYFRKGNASFRSNIASLAFDAAVFKRILKLGFPGFIIGMMGLLQAIVVFNAIVGVSMDAERDLAFFAAANRIMLLLMTPLFGLMRALQPIAGVNYGAEQFGRTKASYGLFVKTGFLLVFPFWIFMNLFPELSLRLVLPNFTFTADDLLYFHLYMFMLPIFPLVFNALTWLPAVDRPKYASLVGVARQVVFFVPVMLIVPHYFGLAGIYYGAVTIDIVITVWLVWLVRRAMKNMEVEKALV